MLGSNCWVHVHIFEHWFSIGCVSDYTAPAVFYTCPPIPASRKGYSFASWVTHGFANWPSSYYLVFLFLIYQYTYFAIVSFLLISQGGCLEGSSASLFQSSVFDSLAMTCLWSILVMSVHGTVSSLAVTNHCSGVFPLHLYPLSREASPLEISFTRKLVY